MENVTANNMWRGTSYLKTLLCLGIASALFLMVSASGDIRNKDTYDLELLRALYSSQSTERWPRPHIDSSAQAHFREIGPLGKVTYPVGNPHSKEKEKLGRALFFDPRLSVSGQISCASCHEAQLGWGDGKSLAHGHNRVVGKRNAMTLYNVAFYERLFWDGRAASLEDQVHFPLEDPVEMNTPMELAVAQLQQVSGYRTLFADAFGDTVINASRLAQAIATFERSIVSYPSRFDRFVQGNKQALNDQEVIGLHLFRTKARCINCHNGPLFSDNRFHNDGQALIGSKFEDLGIFQQTGRQSDIGAFRTPSLREVALTGPWMHHGNFPSLLDVVQFYNLGNPAPIQKHAKIPDSQKPIPSPLLKKLDLSPEEIDAVVAFLKSIGSSEQRRVNMPMLPP